MIWFDGQNWQTRKFKVTEIVESYSDSKDGYSEDTTFQEVVLTEEQQERLEEIQGIEFNEMDAALYVRDGIGGIPDNRSTEDKLIDKIIELNPDAISDIVEVIKEWVQGQEYSRNIYVRFNGEIYKTIHPVGFYEIGTPPERTDLYVRIGRDAGEGDVEVEEWSQEKSLAGYYTIGKRAYYQGKLYEAISGNGAGINTWKPDEYGWKVVE